MDSSLFAKLPAELRNSIYELALFVPEGIELGFFKAPVQQAWDKDSTLETRAQEPHHLSPNLLATCKQIHREALPIFLSNDFSVPLNWGYLLKTARAAGRAFEKWATPYTGSKAHLLTNLNVTYADNAIRCLTGIATFTKHALPPLKAKGLHISLTIDIDFLLRVCGKPSPFIATLDLGLKSADENRQSIQQALRKAKDAVKPWHDTWARYRFPRYLGDYERGLHLLKAEAQYVESMVACAQEGGVWTAEEAGCKSTYEERQYKSKYEYKEDEGEVDEKLREDEYEDDENWSRRGKNWSGKGRGSKKKGLGGRKGRK